MNPVMKYMQFFKGPVGTFFLAALAQYLTTLLKHRKDNEINPKSLLLQYR